VSFLLDTNLLSEWVRERPDPGVVGWSARVDEDLVFVSVVTLAELRLGVESLAPGRRRNRLDDWLRDDLPQRFEGRILAVDERIGDIWGRLVAERSRLGRPIGAMDALLAATARLHNLTVVTRNEADFQPSVAVFNPWSN